MLAKEHYKNIFNLVEANLIQLGSKTFVVEKIHKNLDEFKQFENKVFSDFEYYRKLVLIVFYSGFRASTVTAKSEIIFSHFPDYRIVANYEENDITEILENKKMIKNRNKVRACVNNAKTFENIVKDFGSFQHYVDTFSPCESFENLLLFKEEIESKFVGLGKITAFHFMTDIGLPVLKPDRVICRIFKRLGLIENENQLLKTIIHGRKFAEATNLPIRYIDIIFVAYGQMQSSDFGIEKGICLERNPACEICTLTKYCCYYKSKNE